MNRYVFSLQIVEYCFSWLFCLLVFLGGILDAFVYPGSFGSPESVAGVLGIVTGGAIVSLVAWFITRFGNRQGIIRRVFVLATCVVIISSLAINLLFIQVTLSTLALGTLLLELGRNGLGRQYGPETVLGSLDNDTQSKARIILTGLIVASFSVASTFWMQWSISWTNAFVSSPGFATLAVGALVILLALYLVLQRAWREDHTTGISSPPVGYELSGLGRGVLVARSIVAFVLAILLFVYLALVDEQVNFNPEPAGYVVSYAIFPGIAVIFVLAVIVLSGSIRLGKLSTTNWRRWLVFWMLFFAIAIYYLPFLGNYHSMFGRFMQASQAVIMHACMLLVLPAIGGIFLHQVVITSTSRASSVFALIAGIAGTLTGLVLYKGGMGYPGLIVVPTIVVIVLIVAITASYHLSSAMAKATTSIPDRTSFPPHGKCVRPSGHFMIIGIACMVGIEMAFISAFMDFSAIELEIPVVGETITAGSLRGLLVLVTCLVFAGTTATLVFLPEPVRKKLGDIYCSPWAIIAVIAVVALVYYVPYYLGSKEIDIITRQYASVLLLPAAFLIPAIAGGLVQQLAGYRIASVDIFYGILSVAIGLVAGAFGYEMYLRTFDNIYVPAIACCVLVLTLIISWIRARTGPACKRRHS